MLLRIAADSLVLFHLTFILFVLFGGLLALKWRRVMWLHLPAAAGKCSHITRRHLSASKPPNSTNRIKVR